MSFTDGQFQFLDIYLRYFYTTFLKFSQDIDRLLINTIFFQIGFLLFEPLLFYIQFIAPSISPDAVFMQIKLYDNL